MVEGSVVGQSFSLPPRKVVFDGEARSLYSLMKVDLEKGRMGSDT